MGEVRQLLILAFGATGDHTAARWWIDWQKEAYGKAGRDGKGEVKAVVLLTNREEQVAAGCRKSLKTT